MKNWLSFIKNKKQTSFIIIGLSIFLVGACIIQLSFSNRELKSTIAQLKTEIQNNRKIYVYDIDKTIQNADFITKKQQFEKDVEKLNNEVNQAKKKINSLKNAKVKTEFSDVYIQSLRLKRDTLVENYNKYLEGMLEKINKHLEQIAIEKNVPAIFNSKTIAVNTNEVVDVTDEIIARITE